MRPSCVHETGRSKDGVQTEVFYKSELFMGYSLLNSGNVNTLNSPIQINSRIPGRTMLLCFSARKGETIEKPFSLYFLTVNKICLIRFEGTRTLIE